ncbi:TPA: hypothetical protein ACV5ZF_004617 [Salmonella enterica]|nr:hypothetical protein [Salmonella enterica]ECC3554052.1 hypothetical protein [Salmonella enterica subsp. salamae]HCM1853283.1 hypothetical protein [Salmonella enterica subsp. salamae serovar 42:z29:-]AZT25071.1 hypothetical protein ELZ76_14560 [Salmonella enterica subsp. salamae serovar 42:r:-]AZT51303.1 hypothetical protein EL003_14530 [Salmonella enterica subsp. salamae serovar 42:r:-]AZT55728.1 hypothetical protein EL009_14575 [Salmonella enterica subsp. salamae serovar 42:r:-]
MEVLVSGNGKRLISSGTFNYEHEDTSNDEGLKIVYNDLNLFIKIQNVPDTKSSGDSLRANVNGNNVTFFYECKDYNLTFRNPTGMIKPIEVAMTDGRKIYLSWIAKVYPQGPGRAIFSITYSIYENE